MAQDYEINCFDSTADGQVDLQKMENNFECLRSMFSGNSAPTISGAGQTWFDTSTEILKIRNYDDSEWIGIMTGDVTHKIWVYSNSAYDGWVISSSTPVDCVIALKTDSGVLAYNVNGGEASDSSWTQPFHVLTTDEIPGHIHGSAGAHGHYLPVVDPPMELYIWYCNSAGTTYSRAIGYAGAHTHGSAGLGNSHNHGGITYRPTAAVGIMINLNI